MPARNSTKDYIPNGYYHLYNRGVEKRVIFLDRQDSSVYLSYLKEYLLQKDEKTMFDILSDPKTSSIEKDKATKSLRLNNFAEDITLLAYCLMPNHFHFLIKQKSANSIDKFMQSLSTRYTMYFNHKYKRVGSLYQGVYKAVLVNTNEQLLHLSLYIHKQALALQGVTLETHPCSYPEYVGKRRTEWVKPEEILSHFSKTNPLLSYESFVKQEGDPNSIHSMIIED